jgi:hypothetical protein
MIGRTEWFTYRMGGWGIAAKTWQGWVYILGATALFVTIGALPLPEKPKAILMGTIGGVFILDCLVIMAQLGKVHDERDRLHQLIIERNCSFAAVFALVGAMAYQTYQHRADLGAGLPFDPLIAVVLLIMAATKFGSTLYLRWKR